MTRSHKLDSPETAKLVVAMRMARVAIGLSQQELADHMGIAKTTLARFETLEGVISAEVLTKLTRFFHFSGVDLDLVSSEEDVHVTVRRTGVNMFKQGLENEGRRRSDRRKVRGQKEAGEM